MKLILTRISCCIVAALVSCVALADNYPSRPVKIVVHTGAGTLVDVTVRQVAEKMSEILKQPVIVENMAGAGGLLGIRHVKNAPADGYTVLAATNTLGQAPVLVAAPGYELKDFTALGGLNQAPLVMVGPVTQPAKTIAELIAQARAQPDSLSFASGGYGTSTYLAAAMFLHQAGLKMTHVPYKGTGAAMPDVIGGRVNMMFDAESSTGPHIRDSRLRAFGVTSTVRSKTLPDVGTIAEQVLPSYAYTIYNGLVVRAGTPPAIVQRLASAVATAVAMPSVLERFVRDGTEPLPLSAAAFNSFVSQDSARIRKLAADMGMEKQ